MPSPPFPAPDSAVLALIVANAVNSVHSGEASIEEAILHAAVHDWQEGLCVPASVGPTLLG
jgi:hypothetical protein